MEIQSRIFFAEEKLKENLERLKKGKSEEQELYSFITQAFSNIEKNAFSGIQIPKRLIPKEYIKKYKVDNIWKYNLPNAWRLLYSITNKEIEVISLILDWKDHKEYERLFKF